MGAQVERYGPHMKEKQRGSEVPKWQKRERERVVKLGKEAREAEVPCSDYRGQIRLNKLCSLLKCGQNYTLVEQRREFLTLSSNFDKNIKMAITTI